MGVATMVLLAAGLFADSRPAMGTRFTVRLHAADEKTAARALDAAFFEIERVEALLSHYRQTSELSRINRLAAAGPVETTSEVFELLARLRELGRLTSGAFDPTVGPLMKAWGLYRGTGRAPTRDVLERARTLVGWQHVGLDDAARSVRFDVSGVELDPGAFGKGYALDCAGRVLREEGVRSALLEAGSSSFLALGHPPARQGWTLRVTDPARPLGRLSRVVLADASLATSGSGELAFEVEGRTLSHILDPRTGWPSQGVLQASIVAPTATLSDVLSTAACVLGEGDLDEVLDGLSDVAALLVLSEDGEAGRGRVRSWHWPDEGEDVR